MLKRTILCLLLACCLLFQATALAAAPVQTEGITVPVMENMKQYEIPDNEAMALLRDMTCCFLLLHVTRLPHTNEQYPLVERRSVTFPA